MVASSVPVLDDERVVSVVVDVRGSCALEAGLSVAVGEKYRQDPPVDASGM